MQANFRRTEIATNNQEAARLGAVPGSPLCCRGRLRGPYTVFLCPAWPLPRPGPRPGPITPEPPCHPISKATSRTSRCSRQRSPARLRGSLDSLLLEQMDLEVREIPPQSRGMYSNRMRSYKQEMGKLETDFKRSRIAYSDEVRNELLGDDGNSSENQLIKLREERAHLLDNTERLERSSRRLEAGYQIAVETEQIGQEMLENLSHDREKIQRARERLRETDANLGKSSRVLTGMLRRIIQNRILVVILAIILVVTILMAITFSVRRR
uniref:t-SNARE coiled-coil homology domain-containing protein n=1 Tax=Felis catus TaxID=9685 RepID=A0ABI7W1N2_FELCA